MNTYTRKTLLASMVGLFAAGGASGTLAQGGEAATEQGRIDEIIVTANRREQSLNDAALSIAAIGGEEISRRNLTEMNDYLRTLPGVNFVEVGLGNNAAIIRGIGIDPQSEGLVSSPTTGIYFGEVSLAGLSATGGSSDLKMVDLERVEVLRGPQGTLFGSSALAGVVRNIPQPPVLDKLQGSLKTSYSSTAKNGSGNTQVEGVINIPLIDDELAIRAIAYRHNTSGYIKNIAGTVLSENGNIFPGFDAASAVALYGGAELYQNQEDLGSAIHTGGRVSLLWHPADNLNITLQHIYQDVEQKGQPYVELSTGSNYEQVTLQFGDGEGVSGQESGYEDKINISNLVIEYDLGWGSMLSSSSWIDQDSARNQDQSAFGGFPVPQLILGPVDVFSQEVRLTSQNEGPVQYVAGVYYEEVDIRSSVVSWASTDEIRVAFGAPFGASRLLHISLADKFTDQLAFYGELAYTINDRLEVTLGARHFDYDRDTHDVGNGVLGNFDVSRGIQESGTTFKTNLAYSPDDNKLLYMQWAEGFRLGSTTFPVAPACDADNDGILDGTNQPITSGFDSDSTENFELGAKLAFFENQLQLNMSAYRINWQGIPIFVQGSCGAGVVGNAGKARSEGFELETIYHFNSQIRVNLGAAYTNAELTEDAPGIGIRGDRLPSTPEYSVNIGLIYEFDLNGHSSYFGGDYAYVSEFFNKPGETGVELGEYGQFNMSAGLDIGSFNIELYGRNLTNEDALTHADVVLFDDRAYQLRPRTIGLSVRYEF